MPYGWPMFDRDDRVEFDTGDGRLDGVVWTVNYRDICYGGKGRSGTVRWIRDASYDIFVEDRDAALRSGDGLRSDFAPQSGDVPRGILHKNVAERYVCRPGGTLPDSTPSPERLWRRGVARSGGRDGRILFSGDIHCKGMRLCPLIEEAADRTDAGTVVLLGDLLNEWDISAAGEVKAFEHLADWVERQRRRREVIVLLGNHDMTYWAESNTPDYRAFKGICPGFNEAAWPDVHDLLHGMKPRIMFGFEDAQGRQMLASHAGVTQDWWDWMVRKLAIAGRSVPVRPSAIEVADMVNAFATGASGALAGGIRPFGVMVGRERGGDRGAVPSPVWAGKEELARDPLTGFDQIVGHSPVVTVERRRCGIGTGALTQSGARSKRSRARLWYCDTHSLYRDGRPIGDGSFLLVDRGIGGAWRVLTS